VAEIAAAALSGKRIWPFFYRCFQGNGQATPEIVPLPLAIGTGIALF